MFTVWQWGLKLNGNKGTTGIISGLTFEDVQQQVKGIGKSRDVEKLYIRDDNGYFGRPGEFVSQVLFMEPTTVKT